MISTEELLAQFEREKQETNCSVHDFIIRSKQILGSDLQLSLIRSDLKFRFLSGESPVASDYEREFQHFGSAISQLIESVLKEIRENHLPVENRLGCLPQDVGDYRIVEQVGRDSCSVHYDAIQISLERRVRIRALIFPTSGAVSKARSLALLQHPNLDNTLNVLQLNGLVLVVSQMVFGNSLQQLLRNSPDLISPIRVANWIHMVVSGLVEAHRSDIAHMALSPQNIIIRDDGEAVVVNFSLDADARKQELPWKVIRSKYLPFPYRMFGDFSCTNDLANADTRAMGILFFQLLCKRPLDGFYDQLQLPKEAKRVRELIQSCLESPDVMSETLNSICRRASEMHMADQTSWTLQDFLVELSIWKRCYFLSDTDVNGIAEIGSSGRGGSNVRNDAIELRESRPSPPKRIVPQLKKLLSAFVVW